MDYFIGPTSELRLTPGCVFAPTLKLSSATGMDSEAVQLTLREIPSVNVMMSPVWNLSNSSVVGCSEIRKQRQVHRKKTIFLLWTTVLVCFSLNTYWKQQNLLRPSVKFQWLCKRRLRCQRKLHLQQRKHTWIRINLFFQQENAPTLIFSDFRGCSGPLKHFFSHTLLQLFRRQKCCWRKSGRKKLRAPLPSPNLLIFRIWAPDVISERTFSKLLQSFHRFTYELMLLGESMKHAWGIQKSILPVVCHCLPTFKLINSVLVWHVAFWEMKNWLRMLAISKMQA